jgi:hypothetical protein
VLNVISRIGTWIKETFDPFTPILTALLVNESKKKFQEKGFTVLDFYFDQIIYNCYPMFSQLYDQLLEAMPTDASTENWLKIYGSMSLFNFFSKSLHFVKNLYYCSEKISDNQMIKYRTKKLLEVTLNFVKNLGKIEGTGKSGVDGIEGCQLRLLDFVIGVLKGNGGAAWGRGKIGGDDMKMIEQVNLACLGLHLRKSNFS